MSSSDLVHVFSWAKSPAGGQPVLPWKEGIVLPTGRLRHFSDEDCQRIIDLSETLEPRVASTGDGRSAVAYHHRRSIVRQLFPGVEEHKWIFRRIEEVVVATANHFGFELTGFYEGAQYYDYPTGGFLDAHMDIARGQLSTRKLGISVQLSDAASYEGGDLEFLSSTQTAPREKGSVIIFPTFMMHRVTPLTRGTRKCLVTWVHGPPFR